LEKPKEQRHAQVFEGAVPKRKKRLDERNTRRVIRREEMIPFIWRSAGFLRKTSTELKDSTGFQIVDHVRHRGKAKENEV